MQDLARTAWVACILSLSFLHCGLTNAAEHELSPLREVKTATIFVLVVYDRGRIRRPDDWLLSPINFQALSTPGN